MSGTDANGSPLTWTETGLPPGLGIDPNSGVISGTPAAGDAAQGPYQVTVTATDAAGYTESQTFPLDVASAAPAAVVADSGDDPTPTDLAFASLDGPDAVPLGTGLDSPAADDIAYMGSAPDGDPAPPAPPADGPLIGRFTWAHPLAPTLMTQRDAYDQNQETWDVAAAQRMADHAAKAKAVIAQGDQLQQEIDDADILRTLAVRQWNKELHEKYWPKDYEDVPVNLPGIGVVSGNSGREWRYREGWDPYKVGPDAAALLKGKIENAKDSVNFRVVREGNDFRAKPVTEEGRRKEAELLSRVIRMKVIAQMSAGDKLTLALNLALQDIQTTDRFSADVQKQIEGLLSPTNIGIMAAMVGGGVIAQGTPLMPFVDAIGYAMFGSMIFQVGEDVTNFIASAVWAVTDADFQAAANSLLDALATVVVQGGVLFLAHSLKARAAEVTDVPAFEDFTPGKSAPKVDPAKYGPEYERIFGKRGEPIPDEGIKEAEEQAKAEEESKPRRNRGKASIPEENQAGYKPGTPEVPDAWEQAPADPQTEAGKNLKDLMDQDLVKRTDAQTARNKAVQAGDEKAAEAARQQVIDASKRLGVNGAKMLMAEHFPNADLDYVGTAGSNQSTSDLDLVFIDKNTGTYYVIEAKGGTANNLRVTNSRGIDSGALAEQGNINYLKYVLKLMQKPGHPGADIAAKVENALPQGKVRYFRAETRIDTGDAGQSVVDGLRLREYDLPQRGTP